MKDRARSIARSARVSLLLGLGWVVASCASSSSTGGAFPGALDSSPPLTFALPLADGNGYLQSDALRGRQAVLVFITTFDLASQAQARYLSSLAARHGTRVAAAAIVLEPLDNRPLVLAFRDALKLRYPVAFADGIADAHGPFGELTVPTTIVLDAQGRVTWRKAGLSTDAELADVLAHHVPTD